MALMGSVDIPFTNSTQIANSASETANNADANATEALDKANTSVQQSTDYNGVMIDDENGIQVTSLLNLLKMNATDGLKMTRLSDGTVIFYIDSGGNISIIGAIHSSNIVSGATFTADLKLGELDLSVDDPLQGTYSTVNLVAGNGLTQTRYDRATKSIVLAEMYITPDLFYFFANNNASGPSYLGTIEVMAAGHATAGGGTNAVKLSLQDVDIDFGTTNNCIIKGSTPVLNSQLDHGTTTITGMTTAGTTYSKRVPFNKTFSSIPTVTCSCATATPNTAFATPTAIDTTGFTVNGVRTASTADLSVFWQAVGN